MGLLIVDIDEEIYIVGVVVTLCIIRESGVLNLLEWQVEHIRV